MGQAFWIVQLGLLLNVIPYNYDLVRDMHRITPYFGSNHEALDVYLFSGSELKLVRHGLASSAFPMCR